MKKIVFFALAALALFSACKKDSVPFTGVEGITFENYPLLDGSTSCRALIQMTAYKQLGVRYDWSNGTFDSPGEWFITPRQEDIPAAHRDRFAKIKTSRTHGAFTNLIDGKAELILTHRTLSPDEQAYAKQAGVTLIETPIAADAFVFIKNKNNPVQSLTVKQIRDIYTGRATNWSQIGGRDTKMEVFTRPRNSGSEEIFRLLVMGGEEPAEFPEASVFMMWTVFQEVRNYEGGFCYTFDNYKSRTARIPDSEVPRIAVNGVFPDERSIRNGTYPFISQVHVAIRSDLDRSSMAYKLYEWLCSPHAKATLAESGFLPNR